MHTLLLGNGVNRISLGVPWIGLLEELAKKFKVAHRITLVEEKPLSILFEEICAHCTGRTFRETEVMVKKEIGALIGRTEVSDLHRSLLEMFDVVLTTNYDDTIERAWNGPLFEDASPHRESRYSLFRRVRTGGKQVWHIHGTSNSPTSLLLGYDQYAGYLQKIRNYVTDGIRIGSKDELVKSPLKTGATEFEKFGREPSWVDHFLRDHLHIVGLGLEFTEIDLWWLLLHKRRRQNVTGHTFYYRINCQEHGERGAARTTALASLGVKIQEVHAASYEQGYRDLIPIIRSNIAQHPYLLPLRQKALTHEICDDGGFSHLEDAGTSQLTLIPKR